MSNLIRDVFSFGELTVLKEANSAQGPTKLRGRFQLAEEKNQNGRIYDQKLLEREVNRLQPMIEERRLVGELDHPTDEVVHLTNASHLITNLTMEGKEVIGEIEILGTPAGKVLEELVKAGVKVGTSSRAVGGLSYDSSKEAYMVEDNLKMITWDMVSDPSCPEAFPGLTEGVISENRQPIVDEIEHLKSEKIYIQALSNFLNKK